MSNSILPTFPFPSPPHPHHSGDHLRLHNKARPHRVNRLAHIALGLRKPPRRFNITARLCLALVYSTIQGVGHRPRDQAHTFGFGGWFHDAAGWPVEAGLAGVAFGTAPDPNVFGERGGGEDGAERGALPCALEGPVFCGHRDVSVKVDAVAGGAV